MAQIDELKKQRHIEKSEFYAQIEHYKNYLQMRAQAKKDAQVDNRQIWKKQIAEREQKAREWKFQDMHAPVGSPLNFIKMN